VDPAHAALIIDQHYLHGLEMRSGVRATHLIRDPRDIVVSGYYYHLRTSEPWANVPLHEFPHIGEKWAALPLDEMWDLTYRQYLTSLPKSEGMRIELLRAAATSLKVMADWDYGRRNVLELKYKDILGNDEETFHRVFQHFGFAPKAVNVAVDIACSHSLRLGSPLNRSSLLRAAPRRPNQPKLGRNQAKHAPSNPQIEGAGTTKAHQLRLLRLSGEPKSEKCQAIGAETRSIWRSSTMESGILARAENLVQTSVWRSTDPSGL
jgi:hypothetical protein